MKINFFLTKIDMSKEQNGIHSAATRFAEMLRKNGIDVDINGKGYDYDIFHSHVPSPVSIYKFKKGRKRGIKTLTHGHTTINDVRGSFIFTQNSLILTQNETFLKHMKNYMTYYYNQGDLVLTPSRWAKENLAEAGVNVPIEVLSNGINLKKFKYDRKRGDTFRKEHGVDKKDVLVYSVGMVFIRKGVDIFKQIAKKMPEIKFFWIGKLCESFLVNSKPMKKLFSNMPENCEFLGFVKDIVGACSGGDIFCFPTRAETQGIVILEAAACKSPIIVTDLPVFKDWLFEGGNCLKAKSVDDFADSIEKIIENKKLRDKLIKNGTKLAKENDINKTIKQLIGHYENLLNS